MGLEVKDRPLNARRRKKQVYRTRLEGYLREYSQIMLIQIDMVGSQQMQNVRMLLRGRGAMLMGKNTIIRKVFREMLEEIPTLEDLIPFIKGNVGMVFTDDDLSAIREIVTAEKVPAAARPGVVAQCNVVLPRGPTGLDPGQTSFFQAMNIATKIVKGTIELINDVELCTKGEKVSPSAVALLSKMDLKPFEYGIEIKAVYEGGCVYGAEILDLTDDDLIAKFQRGVTQLTCISLAIGQPNACTLPHSFARAFKNILALAVETKINFEQAEKYKLFLEDPEAAAAKFGLVAAAPAAEEKKEEAAAAPAAAESDDDDESEESMDFDLFD